MKKKKAGVSLDEVYSKSEKDPKWTVAYEKAGIEVRMAIQIAKARERAQLSQGQLAKAVGTTQSVISRIERADQNLTLETLSRIADVLRGRVQAPALLGRHGTGTREGRGRGDQGGRREGSLRQPPGAHRQPPLQTLRGPLR
ncbi:MAG: helix-turn-helix transcriptional regulator [Elusimicrobia bacterium]|nr:helix-turn-helix transcriptional regulator [Elusimicrobiota bacterium]